MPMFDTENYVDCQERINRFWTENPEGAIRTRLMSPMDDFTQCRFEAAIFKRRDSTAPDATGYAFELAGGGGANKTSHEENCETSAIGRALANMGYATKREDRPSKQEMDKANRGSNAPLARPQQPPQRTQPSPTPINAKASDDQRIWLRNAAIKAGRFVEDPEGEKVANVTALNGMIRVINAAEDWETMTVQSAKKLAAMLESEITHQAQSAVPF